MRLVEEGTYITSHKGELLKRVASIRTRTQVVQGYADVVHHHHGRGGGCVGVQGVGGVGVQPCAQKYLSVEVTKTLVSKRFPK